MIREIDGSRISSIPERADPNRVFGEEIAEEESWVSRIRRAVKYISPVCRVLLGAGIGAVVGRILSSVGFPLGIIIGPFLGGVISGYVAGGLLSGVAGGFLMAVFMRIIHHGLEQKLGSLVQKIPYFGYALGETVSVIFVFLFLFYLVSGIIGGLAGGYMASHNV